ncbi:MAG: hypothetical protein SVO01_00845 [Thermotogota bacterium]|nr:hypothetical protein [Thermotogota bacterium]
MNTTLGFINGSNYRYTNHFFKHFHIPDAELLINLSLIDDLKTIIINEIENIKLIIDILYKIIQLLFGKNLYYVCSYIYSSKKQFQFWIFFRYYYLCNCTGSLSFRNVKFSCDIVNIKSYGRLLFELLVKLIQKLEYFSINKTEIVYGKIIN